MHWTSPNEHMPTVYRIGKGMERAAIAARYGPLPLHLHHPGEITLKLQHLQALPWAA